MNAVTDLGARPEEDCRYDVVALGEVMLRLDPGEERIRSARSFRVWEGGGEYNVARGLRRTFGHRAAVVTALVDNPIGHLVEDLVLQGGVDTGLIRWARDDGVGRAARNGLNVVERGFGVRGALGCSDRGHTAVSQLRPGEVDWDGLFGGAGVRWFHTGGVFAALSDSTAEVAAEALRAARRHGVVTSFDLNYRESLWRDRGGLDRAQRLNRELSRHVDVLIGLPWDQPVHDALDQAADAGVRVVAVTERQVRSAGSNDWGAFAWSPDTGVVRGTDMTAVDVLDRVGVGDAFVSGLVHGLLTGEPLRTAVDYGLAHGALAMSTPGDSVTATLAEVRALASGAGAAVRR
ncbi:sugar kinase [Actinosynnema sp. NPDC023658]|uniref:sugar kinase n=1 Tax=Actinosynnema sp. NPDC023658 TaxID=3155465 RepID=UPI0033E9B655